MINDIIKKVKGLVNGSDVVKPSLRVYDVEREINKEHVQFLDVDNSGVGTECAVLKLFSNGDIIYLQINKLNNTDLTILSDIITEKENYFDNIKGLWDKLRRKTIHGDVNALEYFHEMSEGITCELKTFKLVKMFDFWKNKQRGAVDRAYLRDELIQSNRDGSWDLRHFKSTIYEFFHDIEDIDSIEELNKKKGYGVSFKDIETLEDNFNSDTLFVFKGIQESRITKLTKAELFHKIRNMKTPNDIHFDESYIMQTINEKPKLLKQKEEASKHVLITESEDTSLVIRQKIIKEQFYLVKIENFN